MHTRGTFNAVCNAKVATCKIHNASDSDAENLYLNADNAMKQNGGFAADK